MRGESIEEFHLEEDNSWGNYLLRSNRVARIILGAALTLSLTLLPNPGRAQSGGRASLSGDATLAPGWMGKRYAKGFGVSETPTTEVIAPQDRHFLMASLNSRRPVDRLPRFTSPLPIVSLPLAPPDSRSKSDNLTDRTLTQARSYIGTPYRRGGSLQSGHSTDCSGFVQFIYKKANIDLPRSSSEQARVGMKVAHSLDLALLLPGDLLFFGHRGRHIDHAGIYLGDGKMIHAADRRRGVIMSDLRQSSYAGAFVAARRLVELQYPQPVSMRKPLPMPPFGN